MRTGAALLNLRSSWTWTSSTLGRAQHLDELNSWTSCATGTTSASRHIPKRRPLPPTWTAALNVDRSPQRGPQRSVWTERSPWTAALSVDRSAPERPQQSTTTAALHSDRSASRGPQSSAGTAALHESRNAFQDVARGEENMTRRVNCRRSHPSPHKSRSAKGRREVPPIASGDQTPQELPSVARVWKSGQEPPKAASAG